MAIMLAEELQGDAFVAREAAELVNLDMLLLMAQHQATARAERGVKGFHITS